MSFLKNIKKNSQSQKWDTGTHTSLHGRENWAHHETHHRSLGTRIYCKSCGYTTSFLPLFGISDDILVIPLLMWILIPNHILDDAREIRRRARKKPHSHHWIFGRVWVSSIDAHLHYSRIALLESEVRENLIHQRLYDRDKCSPEFDQKTHPYYTLASDDAHGIPLPKNVYSSSDLRARKPLSVSQVMRSSSEYCIPFVRWSDFFRYHQYSSRASQSGKYQRDHYRTKFRGYQFCRNKSVLFSVLLKNLGDSLTPVKSFGHCSLVSTSSFSIWNSSRRRRKAWISGWDGAEKWDNIGWLYKKQRSSW